MNVASGVQALRVMANEAQRVDGTRGTCPSKVAAPNRERTGDG
jgi:hypothetical protein